MPHAKLALPDSPHTQVFRKVVMILRGNPRLKAAVKTWKVWDGDPHGMTEPTYQQAPWVRLSPGGQDGGFFTANQQRVPLVIAIETFTAGLNADDPMNLWWAIAQALFPGDGLGTVIGAIQGLNNGVEGAIQLSAPAFPTHFPAEGGAGFRSDGTITLPLLLTTQI